MYVRHSLPPFMSIELFQKKSKKGVGSWYRYISEKTLGNSYICHFTLRKQAFTPGNFTDLCYTHWKLQYQTSKTNGKCTWIFLHHPQKIHFFFNWFWTFCLLFPIPLQIPCPESPHLFFFFFWNRVVIKNSFG